MVAAPGMVRPNPNALWHPMMFNYLIPDRVSRYFHAAVSCLVRLLTPFSVPPAVRVDVVGGIAHLVSKPRGIVVEIRDYDQERSDPKAWGLTRDSGDGGYYASSYFGPEERVTG